MALVLLFLVLVIVTIYITVYSYTVLCTSLWWSRWRQCRPIQRRWNEFKSGRHMSGAKRRKKNFCRASPLFCFTSTINRFGKRFRVVSTVWSLSCFLFFLLSVTPCPVICKSGGTCPRAPDWVGSPRLFRL